MFRDILYYQDFDIRAVQKGWSWYIFAPMAFDPPRVAWSSRVQSYPGVPYFLGQTSYPEFTVDLGQRALVALNALKDLLLAAGLNTATVREVTDDEAVQNLRYQLEASNGVDTFIAYVELKPAGLSNKHMTVTLDLQVTENGSPVPMTSYSVGAPSMYLDPAGHNNVLSSIAQFEQVVQGELLAEARLFFEV